MMKLKRPPFRWTKVRLPAMLLLVVVLANIGFLYHKSNPGAVQRALHYERRQRLRHEILGVDGGRKLEDRLAKRNPSDLFDEARSHADEQDLQSLEDDHSLLPLVPPTIGTVRFIEGIEGPMSMRVDGPKDALDAKMLHQLAPAISRTGGDSPIVELHAADISKQRARHMRLAGKSGRDAPKKNIRDLLQVLENTSERIDRRFRFVLVVIAVRTRRHLDVFQIVREWQRQCDPLEHLSSGSTPPSSRPFVVCLIALSFPSDFSNRSVTHYASLFEEDDTVATIHTDASLAQGIVDIQQSGFDKGVKHFSRKLSLRAEVDYVLLTSVQFVPVASQQSKNGFMIDLVRQYEDSSDVVDVLARRVAGGATRRGPILGCTTVIDEHITTNGGFAYQGAQVVVEQGVEFLYGNGGGGTMINSMYAVRRHAGLLTTDDRVLGDIIPSADRPIPSQSGVNASQLPRGVQSVHAVSPHCVLMSERVVRMLGGLPKMGASLSSDDAEQQHLLPASRVLMQSVLEDYEDAVGTGNHRSSSISNRTVIGRFVAMDPNFETHSVGSDAESAKAHLLDVVLLRLFRLDHIRSTVRFADVMSGTPQYKRLISFFIRFLDESVRFFDTISPTSFFNIPKDRQVVLQRLPNSCRMVEAAHESMMGKITSREDRVVAGILLASRSLDALGRWYRQQRALHIQRSSHNSVPEESFMWDMCLRARALQLPTLISNMTIRMHQHEYLEAAVLTAPPDAKTSTTLLRISPIFKAYQSGVVLPVSTRLGGPYQMHWDVALRQSALHPSFQQQPRLQVVWYTHCCHCCGFSNELQSLVYPLQHYVNVHLTAGPECFCDNASRTLYDTLERLHSHPQNIKRYHTDDVVVYISHTNPTLYHLHRELNADAQHDYLVGRSMYEFSRIHSEHIEIANRVADEIWVPAQFVYHSYLSSGALREKLVIVPEAIDTHTFNPNSAGRVTLPPTDMFHMCNRRVTEADVRRSYAFLSDFKWEPRKGWDVLFESYFRAFTAADQVVLFVMTHIWFSGGPETYGWANNISWIMEDLDTFMRTKTRLYHDNAGSITRETLPTFCIISQSLPVSDIAALYNSVNGFVYTTRGEGWGLPAMQAMSMGLPVIATNFGGVTEFLKPFNSFLVQLDGVVEIPSDSVYGWSFGTKWAEPSVRDTARLLKYLATHPDHGRRVGTVARQYIIEHFSEEALGRILNEHLQRIREKVLARRAENEMRQQLNP